MSGLLPVSGACPKCGRSVKRQAPRNRVTWRGACPKPGCEGKIIARAVKTAAPTATPPPEERPTPKKKGIPRVGYDAPNPDPNPEPNPVGGAPHVHPTGNAVGDSPVSDVAGGSERAPVGHPNPDPQPVGDARSRRRFQWEHPYGNLGY